MQVGHGSKKVIMNRIATKVINWESDAVLSQIADQINKPLSEIIRLTRHIQDRSKQGDVETNRLSAIMLESSEQLESLVQDDLRKYLSSFGIKNVYNVHNHFSVQ